MHTRTRALQVVLGMHRMYYQTAKLAVRSDFIRGTIINAKGAKSINNDNNTNALF